MYEIKSNTQNEHCSGYDIDSLAEIILSHTSKDGEEERGKIENQYAAENTDDDGEYTVSGTTKYGVSRKLGREKRLH